MSTLNLFESFFPRTTKPHASTTIVSITSSVLGRARVGAVKKYAWPFPGDIFKVFHI